ncbi:MAG: hypothetical protein ABH803_02540 [Candidatus Micrarchaeota archaeon]
MKKLFFTLISVLFLVELMAPLAYAQTTSGNCDVAEISDSERKILWDNVLTTQVEQITDLDTGAALNQQKNSEYIDPLSPNTKIQDPLSLLEKEIKITTLAALLNEDPIEVAERTIEGFDKNKDNPDNYKISIPQAIAYSKTRGEEKEKSLKGILSDYGLIPKEEGDTTPVTPTDTSPEKELKIVIPDSLGENGKPIEFTLEQLNDVPAMQTDSCLLNEEIQGKVTYWATLDQDLVYCNKETRECKKGQYTNPANGKIEDVPTNQFIQTDEATSMLNLNEGGNLIVPAFFEDWLGFSNAWNQVDFYASLGFGITSFYNFKVSGDKIADKERILTNMKNNLQNSDTIPTIQLIQQNRDSLVTTIRGYGNIGFADADAYEKVILKLSNDLQSTDKIIAENAGKVFKELKNNGEVSSAFLSRNGFSDSALGTAPVNINLKQPNLNEMQSAFNSFAETIDTGATKISNEKIMLQTQTEVKSLIESQEAQKRVAAITSKRLAASYFVGGAWLGPARLAFAAANQLIIHIRKEDSNYLRIYANKQSKDSGIGAFRKATDFLGLGTVQERLSSYTGFTTPGKAFEAGRLFIINKPESKDLTENSAKSTTKIQTNKNLNWLITTNWKGSSTTTNFEDLRGITSKEKHTSLSMLYSTEDGKVPDALLKLERQEEAETLTYILQFGLPFIAARALTGFPSLLVLSYGLAVNAKVLQIDPEMFDGVDCSKEKLDSLKSGYRTTMTLGFIVQYLLPYTSLIKTASSAKIAALGTKLDPLYNNMFIKFINTASLPQIIQLYQGNLAMNYVTNCKDSQYKIFTYQALPARNPTPLTDTTTSNSASIIDDIKNALPMSFNKINAKDALNESFGELDLREVLEILNLKTSMENQKSFTQPMQLFNVHIEKSSWSVKGQLFNLLKANNCLPQETLINADGSLLEFSNAGFKKINKDGSVAFAFTSPEWVDRALSRLRNQELAKIILPNKIIYTSLNGCKDEFLNIKESGETILNMGNNCNAVDCFKDELEKLTGRTVTGDLTDFLGLVTSIDTTTGTIVLDGKTIVFIDTSGDRKGVTQEADNGVIKVSGEGEVTIENANGIITAGTLLTIYSGKAKIEFDPDTKKLLLFVYVLAEGNAKFFNGFTTGMEKVNLDGKDIDAPTIEHIDLKDPQMEAELNKALEEILGGKGIYSWETPDAQYLLTTDENGDPILQRIDKETGEITNYKITGTPKLEGDGSVTIPTDKGDINIKFDQNNKGEPAVTVKGPDFEEILATLLTARGQNGILAFNPSTGSISIYNGQDIPMNPDFASKGISFTGSEDGTRGTPATNPFGTNRIYDFNEPPNGNQNLSLPSWPENIALALLMLATILIGVITIRFKRE